MSHQSAQSAQPQISNPFAQTLQRWQRWRIYRILYYFWQHRLTLMGRLLIFATFVATQLIGGKESLSGQRETWLKIPPIYYLCGFLLVTLFIGHLCSFLIMPKLQIRRRKIFPSSAGQQLTLEIEIENSSRRPVFDLTVIEAVLPASITIAENNQMISRLASGETATLTVKLHCQKRGAYRLTHLYAASAFPLGIWRGLRRSNQESSFLVYPAYTTPESFTLPTARQYQPGGFLVSSNVGESPEFMGTREYRSGDNPRHIHWSSWARVGKPIVKQYHEEYFVRLALVVDSAVASGANDAAFEAGISTAAGIADYLSRRDYIIDIFAAGASVYHFQAGRALAHFENILEILACLESSPTVDWQKLSEAVLPEATRLTAVVAIFLDWTNAHDEFVGQLRALGVGVRIIVIRDQPTTLPPPTVAGQDYLQLSPGEKLPGSESE